jgi:hypothetical protein
LTRKTFKILTCVPFSTPRKCKLASIEVRCFGGVYFSAFDFNPTILVLLTHLTPSPVAVAAGKL